jgi:monoamine oxidase
VEALEANVCVVGAGYAGLTALRIEQAGSSVVVLEARDRVGGRVWTDHLADGTPIDRGGAWLGPARTVSTRSPRRWASGRTRRSPPATICCSSADAAAAIEA